MADRVIKYTVPYTEEEYTYVADLSDSQVGTVRSLLDSLEETGDVETFEIGPLESYTLTFAELVKEIAGVAS